MINQGEVLTLENNKEYVKIGSIVLDGINYVYLMNSTDYSDFMFCKYDQVDGLYEVEDPDLLKKLIKEFNKQLSSVIEGESNN